MGVCGCVVHVCAHGDMHACDGDDVLSPCLFSSYYRVQIDISASL